MAIVLLAGRIVQHSRFLNLASLEFVNQRETVCVCVCDANVFTPTFTTVAANYNWLRIKIYSVRGDPLTKISSGFIGSCCDINARGDHRGV